MEAKCFIDIYLIMQAKKLTINTHIHIQLILFIGKFMEADHHGQPYRQRLFFSGVACTCALIPYVRNWKFSKASEIAPTCNLE
jgi:hypothetical protein